MKIQVLSDTHLEFLKNLDVLKLQDFKKADYLFLAGDISIPLDCSLWESFINWCSQNYKVVFYVIGNHESYGCVYGETLAFVREFFCRFNNVIFLEKGVVYDLEGWKVVGCTLWTDLDEISAEYLNDTRMILEKKPYPPASIQFLRNLHEEDKQWLSKVLNDLKSEKVIVMTHHLPTKECVVEKYRGGKYEKGFVAHVDELVPLSNLWIFGHTHSHVNITSGKTRLYANPLGYRHEYDSSGYVSEFLELS